MIGGGVEILGRAAVPVGPCDVRVFAACDAASQRDELLEDAGEPRLIGRRDPHRHERRLVIRAPDAELQHLERRVVSHDSVEHRVEELRIDEMAFGFDDLVHRQITLVRWVKYVRWLR